MAYRAMSNILQGAKRLVPLFFTNTKRIIVIEKYHFRSASCNVEAKRLIREMSRYMAIYSIQSIPYSLHQTS